MVRLVELRKRFGGVTALDGLSLEVNEGEVVVITGPSGCGKSTALRCINRLIDPDSGEVWIGDTNVTELGYNHLLELRKRIGFVFQHFNLISRLTVEENVMLGLVLGGLARERARKKAREALVKVGLGQELIDRMPSEISGGERQRVGIAPALAMQPSLMLWDEPTASLDPILVGDVLDVMEELVRDSETTMVIVTHELKFAAQVADRVILMDRGRVLEEGHPLEVFLNPKTELGVRYKRLFLDQQGKGDPV